MFSASGAVPVEKFAVLFRSFVDFFRPDNEMSDAANSCSV